MKTRRGVVRERFPSCINSSGNPMRCPDDYGFCSKEDAAKECGKFVSCRGCYDEPAETEDIHEPWEGDEL